MKKYSLDKKDEKILETVSDNARLSYNQISKLTKISKDSVRKRLDKLEKNLFILSYFPLINYHALNLKLFHVYLRLKSLEKFDEKIIKKLTENNKIVSITWILGKYDLEIQILGKTKKEIGKKLNFLFGKNTLKESTIITAEELKIYSMNLFKKENQLMQTKKEKVNLDEKDYKLLSSLAKNGRTRIIDLVEELKMDESTIRHRIKKLLKCQVIINFYARTNKHRIGLNTYIILLKTKKKLSDKEIKEIQKLRNLFYLKECGGKYNILARFHTSNNKELITTLNKIRQTFGENLSNYEVFTLLERRKFIPF